MSSRSTLNQCLGFAAIFLITFATSGIGAAASIQAQSFYGQLTQPTWAPPAWVFGPVWTMLFCLMAVSACVIWRLNNSKHRTYALLWYLAQLFLNGLWSWLFFAWNLGALAMLEVVLLWLVIAITLVSFWRLRILAGLLLVPYLLWVTFAAVLNFSLWQTNPALLG